MSKVKGNKFKKFMAMLLAFSLVFGTVPITAAGSPMEVTFVSGQQSGIGIIMDAARPPFKLSKRR